MDEVPELHRAFEIANQADLTPAELEDLERREMFIYDQQGAIALGIEEGRQQGLAQGLEQGLERGLEEGEQQATRAIARNLLDRLDDETIAQTTGLSVEAVRELRQEPMPGLFSNRLSTKLDR